MFGSIGVIKYALAIGAAPAMLGAATGIARADRVCPYQHRQSRLHCRRRRRLRYVDVQWPYLFGSTSAESASAVSASPAPNCAAPRIICTVLPTSPVLIGSRRRRYLRRRRRRGAAAERKGRGARIVGAANGLSSHSRSRRHDHLILMTLS